MGISLGQCSPRGCQRIRHRGVASGDCVPGERRRCESRRIKRRRDPAFGCVHSWPLIHTFRFSLPNLTSLLLSLLQLLPTLSDKPHTGPTPIDLFNYPHLPVIPDGELLRGSEAPRSALRLHSMRTGPTTTRTTGVASYRSPCSRRPLPRQDSLHSRYTEYIYCTIS